MVRYQRDTSSYGDPGGRTDHMQSGDGLRWHYLFYLLAALNVLAICGTLCLSERALSVFYESVDEDLHWAKHVQQMTILAELVIDLTASGSDVFESGDFSQEQARLDLRLEKFDRLLKKIRDDLKTVHFKKDAATLLARLDTVEAHIALVEKQAQRIFSQLAEGHRDEAESSMVAMDRHFGLALTEIEKVTREIQSIQLARFDHAVDHVSFLRLWEIAIGVVVLVIVGLAIWYGRALDRRIKKNHKQFVDERFHLSTILESAAHSNITIDGQGKILSFNKMAIETFGYQSDEVLGKNINILMSSPEREEHDNHLRRYLNGGKPRIMGIVREETVRRKDGTTLPVELSVYDVSRSTDGDDDRMYTGIIRDITAAKKKERELQLAHDAAQAGTKSKGEFLANMSHEIRTPMTAILGFTEVMLENVTDEENIRSLETIQSNGKHLLGLINDVLDLSKIEAGKLVVEKIACSPTEIISHVVSMINIRIEKKNLVLRVHIDSLLPKVIVSDPSRIRQILINLIGNAVKFTATGDINIDVRSTEPDESNPPKIQFRITDTGIGMSPPQIDRLFKPFSQGDSSTTRRFGGTGLGLSISQHLANQLGGDIKVDSSPGEGSTFTLTLLAEPPVESPTASSNPTVAQPSGENVRVPGKVANLHGHRILLAEDGVDNQRIISFFLKKAGALVEVAENGQIAYEMATTASEQGAPFDAIVMDMQMPVLDGYDATRRLRETGYRGAIVALTAHAMVGDRTKCLDAGCDGYDTKPIDRMRLVETIDRCIASRAAVARGKPSVVGLTESRGNDATSPG